MVLPPPPATTAPPTTTAAATTARLSRRAGRRGNRGSQGGYADGRTDGRAHRADAPKHRNRHSCDGLSQQLARCQKAFHHSAHPSFLSSHLHFKHAICETLGWIPPLLLTRERRSDSLCLSHAFRPRERSQGSLPRHKLTGSPKLPGGTGRAYAWQPILPRLRWA